MEPESIEDYYARIIEATGSDGRLPVAVEEMARVGHPPVRGGVLASQADPAARKR